MSLCYRARSPWVALFAGAAWLALAAPPGYGQYQHHPHSPCPTPWPPAPLPHGVVTPKDKEPAKDQEPAKDREQAPPPQQDQQQDISPEASAAAGGEAFASSNVGYIDSAIPRTQFRVRYDSAYRNNRPDRAEFFYPQCGCSGGPGPLGLETSVDYQDIRSYAEVAFGDRFSGFLEVPFRFINPEQNGNHAGLSDIEFGFKGALIADCDRYLTFQLRTYTPTGDGRKGLGTEHYSLEPALLFYQRLGDRLQVEAEFRDWIPLDGTDFAGNVLRYGVGAGYDVYQSCDGTRRVTPIVEVVGWTVLNGKETDPDLRAAVDASGDTIVNVKAGVRFYAGEHSNFYAGYGRALTGEVWYKDIIRVEYRWQY
jgi:hypothetical protein